MRRVIRVLGRLIAGALVILIVALAAAFIVVHTSWGRERVRRYVEAELRGQIGGGATIGRVGGSPFTTMVLHDVSVKPSGRVPAISIREVRFSVSLWRLLARHVRLDDVVASDVEVRLDMHPDTTIEHSTSETGWRISVASLTLRRGRVLIDGGRRRFELADLELAASGDRAPDGSGTLVASLAGTWRENRAPIAVTLSAHADAHGIDVPAASGAIGGISFTVAGVRVPAAASRGIAGTIAVFAPAGALEQMIPEPGVPGDLAVSLDAAPLDGATHVVVDGIIGGSPIRGMVKVDAGRSRARGFVLATGVDARLLSRGLLSGAAGGLAAFDARRVGSARWPAADVLIETWSTGTLAGSALMAAACDGRRIHALATASVSRPVGAIVANLEATGAITPAIELIVAGHLEGTRLAALGVSAARLQLDVAARGVPARPAGDLRLHVTRLAHGDIAIDELTLAATDRSDGTIRVSLHSTQQRLPVIDVDAVVVPGRTIIVELERHRARAANGELWTGRGGRLVLRPDRIELSALRSASPRGAIALDGSYVRAGRDAGDLDVELRGDVPVSTALRGYAGRIEARGALHRRHGRLWGIVRAKARHVGADGSSVLIDGDAALEARRGDLVAWATASTTAGDHVRVDLDLAAPARVLHRATWRRLDRSAIRSARLSLAIDLRSISEALRGVPGLAGELTGEALLDPIRTHAILNVRGVRAGRLAALGPVDAALALDADPSGVIATELTGTVDGTGSARVRARFEIPRHLLDSDAWRSRGVAGLRALDLQTGQLAITPTLLAVFGLPTTLRGSLAVTAGVGPGALAANVSAQVSGLQGGPLKEPTSMALEARIDDRAAHGELSVRSNGITMLASTFESPLTLDRAWTDPTSLPDMPLTASARIDAVPVARLLAVIGAGKVLGGVLDGSLELGGTIRRPTARASLVAHDVRVPMDGSPGGAGVLRELAVDAKWDGAIAAVAIRAAEASDGSLRIDATVDPAARARSKVTLVATGVELAPLAAFVPGSLGAVRGRLDAAVAVDGLDLESADVAGHVGLADASIPIAPMIGTLVHGSLEISIANHRLEARLGGELGNGEVTARATAALTGALPRRATMMAELRAVELVGVGEPVISATARAAIEHVDDRWRARVNIDRAHVAISSTRSEMLAPVGAPADLYYAGAPTRSVAIPTHPHVGSRAPWATATVVIADAYVESNELRGVVSGRLEVQVGPEWDLAIHGAVALDAGTVTLFERRYTVERGQLRFDGSLDPWLDVRIAHEFAGFALTAEVAGRLSEPELHVHGDRTTYSEAELRGFLLGGAPGGPPNDATSLVASHARGLVRHALPGTFDILRYEAETADRSAAIKAGSWITRSLFLAYRHRLAARPDENAGEAEIEYWVRRRLVLAGTVGDRGYGTVDLLWRRRW